MLEPRTLELRDDALLRDSLRKSLAASYAANVIAVATTDFTVVGTMPYALYYAYTHIICKGQRSHLHAYIHTVQINRTMLSTL